VKVNRQSGLTTLGMLLVVALVVGGLLLTIKLAPLYIDDFAIAKALDSLQTERDLYQMTKRDIRATIRRKLAADYTRKLQDDEIRITKDKGTIKVEVVYESRVPIVLNLDVIAKFEHHFIQQK